MLTKTVFLLGAILRNFTGSLASILIIQ